MYPLYPVNNIIPLDGGWVSQRWSIVRGESGKTIDDLIAAMDNHSNHNDQDSNHEKASHGDTQGYSVHGGHSQPGGLSIAADGVRFVPAETRLEPGDEQSWTFRILDDEGETVRDFQTAHGELSHLIVLRRDLTHFQHLHPELDVDGTWSVEFELPTPGVYRAFVDIVVNGQPMTLGVDLFAPGTVDVAPRPTSSQQATVDDYEVVLRPEEVAAGEDTALKFEVRRNGDVVSELAPYLGARGHLVALREGDLAYLHVHPIEADSESGVVEFRTRFPTQGRYRLFLQVRPEGELITTLFDVPIDR